jgi:hypothetical protein
MLTPVSIFFIPINKCRNDINKNTKPGTNIKTNIKTKNYEKNHHRFFSAIALPEF